MSANRMFPISASGDLTTKTMSRDLTEVDVEGIGKAMAAGLGEVGLVKLLVNDEAANVSLVYAWFKPRYKLPRHSHSADCLYYIISGSVLFGNKWLKTGDSFLVPKDNKYRYETGPDGVEILEFRTATTFDISYRNSPSSWDRFAEDVADAQASWRDASPPATAARILQIGGATDDVEA